MKKSNIIWLPARALCYFLALPFNAARYFPGQDLMDAMSCRCMGDMCSWAANHPKSALVLLCLFLML